MQAIEVTMKGFGPFLEEQTFPLQGRGLVLLEGRNHDSTSALSNGAGKTAVLKAITWCQFGQYVDGDKGVEVVHRRAKKGEVRMMWVDEDSDTGYCVTRSQTKQKQSLQLEMTSGDEWVSINGKDKAETQSKLEAILGLDYDTWCNTVLFAAGGLTRFASRGTSDAERKAIFRQVYGLAVVDEARDRIRDQAREVRLQADEAEKAVIRRRAQIDTVNVRALEDSRKAFEAKRASEISRIEALIFDL